MALSADRITRVKEGKEVAYPVAASTTIYNGGMVAVNTSGYAVPAATTAGYKVVGVAREQVDNSSGSNGDLLVRVSKGGAYEMENSATNAVAQADVGRICYVEDDETVADENGGSSVVAGIVDSIDLSTSKIWVSIGGGAAGETEADDISGTETVTDGAISLFTRTSLISITGTQAYTLAAGRYEGQRKTLVVSVAASTPAGTVTPATYVDGMNFHLSEVGEQVELEYHDADGWKLLDYRLSTRGAETVTTGAVSLFTEVTLLSVTGTIAYTLADGLFVGQKKLCIVSAAASTPAGTLTPVSYAGTSEHFSAVGEWLSLEWDGTNWVNIGQNLSRRGAETVTSGACSLFTETTLLSVTGTQAYTLADGLFVGQKKNFVCSVAASTPAGTLTPVSYAGTSEHFSAVGEMLTLEWDGTNWVNIDQHLGVRGAETVTSGALSLYTEVSFISVTGTQAYSLADGLYTGQKKYCRCTVAASTPDGTLTPATPSGFATADFDATEEAYGFVWNGAAWECFYVIGGALS
jgi:hypothetical protein